MKLLKTLTARSTVIALFTAISAALLIASSIPQRTSAGGKTPHWVGQLPDSMRFLSTLLGIDNVVGTSWFAALVFIFWLSLVVSTASQFSSTRAQLHRIPSSNVPVDSTRIEMPLVPFAQLVSNAGYRCVGSAYGVHRYVKNRIGVWGNFLLHIGLVTAVLFILVYVLTQHRVLIRLTGQEITRLSPDTVQEMRGLLPLQHLLPYSVVLKEMKPLYWSNDKLESLSSELYFTDHSGGDPQRVDIAVSDKSAFGHYIVYQANAYGRVFNLELTLANGEIRRERMYLSYPVRRDVAGYGEIVIAETDLLLKGKFYASPDRTTIKFSASPINLRLFRGKEMLGESTLAAGDSNQLGPLTVKLIQSEWWTDILLDDTRGTFGIFAGFALILAGVLASYCLVPREIIIWEQGDALYAQHVLRRFAQFYREEFETIIQKSHTRGHL